MQLQLSSLTLPLRADTWLCPLFAGFLSPVPSGLACTESCSKQDNVRPVSYGGEDNPAGETTSARAPRGPAQGTVNTPRILSAEKRNRTLLLFAFACQSTSIYLPPCCACVCTLRHGQSHHSSRGKLCSFESKLRRIGGLRPKRYVTSNAQTRKMTSLVQRHLCQTKTSAKKQITDHTHPGVKRKVVNPLCNVPKCG